MAHCDGLFTLRPPPRGDEHPDDRLATLSGCGPGLSGPDSDGLLELTDQDASVAHSPGTRDIGDRFEDRLDDAIIHGNFDFGSGAKLRLMDLGYGNALNAELCDRLPQLVQLEWPHDRGDHFHDVHFVMIEILI
jgi:hypothetical protein